MAGKHEKTDAPRPKPGAPSTLPRLDELEPESLARDVQRLVAHKFEELATLLEHAYTAGAELSPVLLARVQQLLRWARFGESPAKGAKALEQLESAIYGRAADELLATLPTVGAFSSVLVDVDTPIGVALAAARSRLDLEDGRPTVGRELAALAGLHRTRVTQLLQSGELTYDEPGSGRRNTTISNESARAWLRSRRVPGF